jgi:IS30 family transposase
LDFFFAKPYHSCERGSNENLNGLIRQYIPKQTDFDTLTDEFIQYVQDQINSRPRKHFNFDTPSNEFNRLTR